MRNTGSNTEGITNRTLGNHFEDEFADLMFNHGFWVHKLTQNQAGQPADIIAVRKKTAYLIDCKVCSDCRFPLSRIEDNQHLAMDMWRDCHNGEAWFALKVEGRIFMIPHLSMKAISITQSSINFNDIIEYGTEFGRWIKKC